MNNNNKCRICAKPYDNTQACVSLRFQVNEAKSILDLLKEWASIGVADEALPQFICRTCFISVTSFVSFIELIQKSDEEFRESKYNSEHALNDNFKEGDNLGVPSKDELSRKLHSFQCTTCHKTFKKLYQYESHLTVHTGERRFCCKVCGKRFARSYVLIYHMRVHTGEKKFSCNYCNKSFIHPSNLYKHKKIHTNTRDYKCELCPKSFIQSEALKIHVRRIHTGEKPFLCEICSKTFSCHSALWLHKQDRHLQKETCPLCKKQFSSRILKLHIERHKNKEQEVKKCICEQCGKIFSSAHNLRQHLLAHDGIKPYATEPTPCPFCKKSYSKRRIKSHVCISSTN